MSSLELLYRTRPRTPTADSLKLGALRSPASSQTNGLQVYYPLNEASGTRYDVVGAGMGPGSLGLRSQNNRLTIADNAELSAGDIDLTFGGWFYMTTNPGEMFLGSKFVTVGNQREYGLFITSGGLLRWTLSSDGTAGGNALSVDAGSPATGRWHFVLGWHDAAANSVAIRWNNGAPVTLPWSLGIFDGTGQFALAVREGTSSVLDGRLKSWFLSKRVYTVAEQEALYNHGQGLNFANLTTGLRTGMVAWWDLMEIAGNRLDSVGSNHLAPNNAVLVVGQGPQGNSLGDTNTVASNTGKVGAAAEFTIANAEQLAAGDSVELRGGDLDWEWTGWVWLAAIATNQTIFSKDSGSAGGREYRLDFLTATAKMTWIVYDGTTAIGTVTTTGTFAAATWYYVRVYHNSVTDKVGIQIDGGTADEASTTGAPASATTTPFRLGANGSGTPQSFGGRLDEWGKWNRLRTAAEIAAGYAAGAGLAYPFT